MKSWLMPLSWIYSFIMHLRNKLYDTGVFKVYRFSTPIVSVGNLTMGGTGKTPIICELLRWSIERGLRPAVISRGYRRTSHGLLKVESELSAKNVGDEPLMMAKMFPEIPIYVAEDRVQGVQEILAKENVDIIFADDAFQHRRLGRDVDIVVIDSIEKKENYRLIPSGRAREDIHGLCRADFIIVNKVNLASPEEKSSVLEFIDSICKNKMSVIESEYYISHFSKTDGSRVNFPQAYERAVLVSAIGNPKAFESLLNKNFDIKKHFVFRDHHNYTKGDLAQVVSEAKRVGAQKIITTSKDMVKMHGIIENEDLFFIAELSPKLSLRVKSLYEKILSQIAKK